MKKYLYSFFAIAIISTALAFVPNKKPVAAKASGYFYQYVGSSTSEADIKNISNYVRSNASCEDGTNLCGVHLTTDKPTGQQPVNAEFEAVKSDLWSSQQSGEPTSASIEMRQ